MYIINKYYNEQNLVVFQKSLNMNYESYIQQKFKEFSYEEISILLSKFIINFIYKKKVLEYIKKRDVLVKVQLEEYANIF